MEREITAIDVFIARREIHLERMRAPVDSARLFSKNPGDRGIQFTAYNRARCRFNFDSR